MEYTSTTVRTVVAILASVTAVASTALAQDSTSTPRPPSAALLALSVGARVQVHTPELGLVTGRLMSADDSIAVVHVHHGGDHSVPAARIDSVWLWSSRMGHGATVGAVAFGIVGAGLGGLANAYAHGMCDSEWCRDDTRRHAALDVLGGAVLGAGAGALLGAMVGSERGSWRRRFPAD